MRSTEITCDGCGRVQGIYDARVEITHIGNGVRNTPRDLCQSCWWAAVVEIKRDRPTLVAPWSIQWGSLTDEDVRAMADAVQQVVNARRNDESPAQPEG